MYTRKGTSRGQSLVELAISLMVIVLLLSGAVDFARALFTYVELRDAAQEGAVFGSLNPCGPPAANGSCDPTNPANLNLTAICNDAVNTSNSPINMTGFSCLGPSDAIDLTNKPNYVKITLVPAGAYECEGSTNNVVHGIQVQVGYDYHISMALVGRVLGSQKIHLTTVVTDTILYPACP